MFLENIKNQKIERAVLETVAFFDIFGRALTPFEIWRHLGEKCELGEMIEVLNQIVIPTESAMLGITIQEKNGYYFLAGQEELSDSATEQYNLTDCKLKIAQKAARKIFYHNGVEMIAIGNNFNYKKESDIDLFIITSRKRLYLTRALITFILHFARLRRHGDKIANRVCLSFYISEESLDLKNIVLPNSDPYLYHWLVDLEPIYGEEMFEKFWQENSWLKEYLPNACPKKMSSRFRLKINPFVLFLRNIVKIGFDSFLGDWLEALAKNIQLRKMAKNQPPDNVGVIINNTMLKFHKNDRRKYFREELLKRLKQN